MGNQAFPYSKQYSATTAVGGGDPAGEAGMRMGFGGHFIFLFLCVFADQEGRKGGGGKNGALFVTYGDSCI